MSWNQPGPGDKDPWGQKGSRNGPPDLDEIVKNMQKALRGLFGGGKGVGSGNGGGGFPIAGGGVIVVLALVIWALTGFYVVDEGTRGVVLRFGNYQSTARPGLQWHIPWPVGAVRTVDVQRVNTVEIGYRSVDQGQDQSVPSEALMLTRDENIVSVNLAVQYDIKDPESFVFHVGRDPRQVVRSATESALREVVGSHDMNFILTGGRGTIASDTEALLQKILDQYQTGINVLTVEMQDAQPPRPVRPAFNDVVKAREDRVRLINEAEAYRNDILPRARGQAARISQEAKGYKEAVIAKAKGEASRFTQILAEYEQAPDITRQRLYLEKMEQVLANSSKLLIDQTGGNNVMYLPLDQLLKRQRSDAQHRSAAPKTVSQSDSDAPTDTRSNSRSRQNLRERGN